MLSLASNHLWQQVHFLSRNEMSVNQQRAGRVAEEIWVLMISDRRIEIYTHKKQTLHSRGHRYYANFSVVNTELQREQAINMCTQTNVPLLHARWLSS